MRRWTTGLLALLVALSFWCHRVGSGRRREQHRYDSGSRGDAQGAVLPGVTVTATSPSALGAQTR